MFTSLRTAQALSGERGRVNELVLPIKRGASLATIQAELDRSLRHVVPGTGFTFTAGSQEAARRLLYKDAEGDQQMMNIFAALLLGAAAFAAFNLISRTVEAQRREIGIGMALGARPRVLALRPLLLGGQVAVLGIALGIPAGLAANAWLRSVMQTFFPLPVLRTPMQLGVFAQGAALGLAVSLLATAIPLRRALAVTPVEAIRVGARAARSSGAAWITRGLRLPGGSLSNMPLRNVLRAPRRTLMTVLGIGAVVAITLALAGVIDSFNATLDASRAEALAGAQPAPDRRSRCTATPGRSRDPRDHCVPGHRRRAAVAASPGDAQRRWTAAGRLPGGRRAQRAAVAPDAQRRHARHEPPRSRDREAGRGGPARASRRQRHGPLPGPDRAKQLSADLHDASGRRESTPVRCDSSPTRTVRPRPRWGWTALSTASRSSPPPVATAADVKRALLAMPAVTAVQGAAATTDAVDQTMAQFTDVLIITVAIAMIMSLLIAYNSAAINAEERTREHATMFAYGVGPARVIRGNVTEALITGALATAIGVAAGYGILALDPRCLDARDDARPRHTRIDLGAHVRPRRARRHRHGRARSATHAQAAAPHRHPVGAAGRGMTINRRRQAGA